MSSTRVRTAVKPKRLCPRCEVGSRLVMTEILEEFNAVGYGVVGSFPVFLIWGILVVSDERDLMGPARRFSNVWRCAVLLFFHRTPKVAPVMRRYFFRYEQRRR